MFSGTYEILLNRRFLFLVSDAFNPVLYSPYTTVQISDIRHYTILKLNNCLQPYKIDYIYLIVLKWFCFRFNLIGCLSIKFNLMFLINCRKQAKNFPSQVKERHHFFLNNIKNPTNGYTKLHRCTEINERRNAQKQQPITWITRWRNRKVHPSSDGRYRNKKFY